MKVLSVDTQGAWLSEVLFRVNKEKNRQDNTEENLPSRGVLESITRLEKAAEADFLLYPTLFQGFYDSHMHPTWMAKLKNQLICSGKNAEQILKEIQASSLDRIYGFAWSDQELGTSIEDFANSLNSLNKEIILFRVCGHMAYVSPLAKKTFQIEISSNFLKENQLELIPRPGLEKNNLECILKEIQESGIDETAELLLRAPDYDTLSQSSDMLQFADVKSFHKFPKAPTRSLRYMKYFLDGSFGARSAWLRKKYSDAETFGIQNWTDAELDASVKKSLQAGYLVAFHAIGDAALDQLLSLGQRMESELKASLRDNFLHRIEHLQLCHDDQIEKLQKQNFWSLGLQPSHRQADSSFINSRLGSRVSTAYRLKSFIDAGLKVSLGSDAPIVPYDPALTFHAILEDSRESERLLRSEIYNLFCVQGRQNAGMSAKNLGTGTKAWLFKAL